MMITIFYFTATFSLLSLISLSLSLNLILSPLFPFSCFLSFIIFFLLSHQEIVAKMRERGMRWWSLTLANPPPPKHDFFLSLWSTFHLLSHHNRLNYNSTIPDWIVLLSILSLSLCSFPSFILSFSLCSFPYFILSPFKFLLLSLFLTSPSIWPVVFSGWPEAP